MGTKVLVHVDIKRCTGLVCIPCVGVLRKSKSANHGSLLSHSAFLNKFLAILMADSAFPFAF